MKKLLAIIAAIALLAGSAFAENGYRASFYLPSVLAQETGKPFIYHTICIAETEAEVRAYIYGEDPAAVILSIEYMGPATTTPAEGGK